MCESSDNGGEVEAWDVELDAELIRKTNQLEGVEIMPREA